jgi:hypothetical protein
MTSTYTDLIQALKLKFKSKNKFKKVIRLINDGEYETDDDLIKEILFERERLGQRFEAQLNDLTHLNDMLERFGLPQQPSKPMSLSMFMTC